MQLWFVQSFIMRNTTFEHNSDEVMPIPDTRIDDLYKTQETGGGINIIAGMHTIDVIIDNCTFRDNTASRNLPNDTHPVLLKQNGHGGALLLRLIGTYNGNLIVNNTQFINNKAQVDGGSIYITYSDNADNNTFYFNGCTFSGNSVDEAAGGAISVNSYNFTYNNSFLISNCIFEGNRASAAGSVSMSLYDSNIDTTERPDRLGFNKCRFIGNIAANEGTAVGLFSLVHVDQVGFLVNFTDW